MNNLSNNTENAKERDLKVRREGNPSIPKRTVYDLFGYVTLQRKIMMKYRLSYPELTVYLMICMSWVFHNKPINVFQIHTARMMVSKSTYTTSNQVRRLLRLGMILQHSKRNRNNAPLYVPNLVMMNEVFSIGV